MKKININLPSPTGKINEPHNDNCCPCRHGCRNYCFLEQNRRLLAMARALRHLKGFDGWVIGSCSFTIAPITREPSPGKDDSFCPGEPSGQTEPELNMLRGNERIAKIQILGAGFPENSKDQLCLLLVHPSAPISPEGFTNSQKKPSGTGTGKSAPGFLCRATLTSEDQTHAGIPIHFSAAETARYLEQVSDYNSIHQGDGAIVPGFLMINRILAFLSECHNIVGSLEAKVRFSAPLHVEETAYLSFTRREGGEDEVSLQKASGQPVLNMRIFCSQKPPDIRASAATT